MSKIKILWADDEIDLLKPHILFLEEKGYEVLPTTSGDDALDILKDQRVDIVFLDENMPGLSGLETLNQIKTSKPSLPVVMITKSEEEAIMEDAIGSKISDYLIKPVNPKQILLSVKKNLDTSRLVTEKTTLDYQQEFRQIGMSLNDRLSFKEWTEVYKKLVYYDIELENSDDEGMFEVLSMQKAEANRQFSRFIDDHYVDWVGDPEEAPVMSHNLLVKKVFPHMKKGEPLFLVLIDNLRWDQWIALKPIINNHFWIDQEELYCSILPTTTHYARNAIFSGLRPMEIEQRFPKLWLNDEDDGGKNQHEQEFLGALLNKVDNGMKFTYNKVLNPNYGRKVVNDISRMMNNDLNVVVYNFIDMLSHARTETDIIRELAEDERAYRSLTVSWFEHSPLFEIMRKIAEYGGKMIITTDHGSVRVKEPSKVVGTREVNANLRYKQGKSLDYVKDDVLEVLDPHDAYLPKVNVSQKFIFAKEDKFFAYPNNYNHYVKYYRDTFQHGGISMEEMLIPIVQLTPRP